MKRAIVGAPLSPARRKDRYWLGHTLALVSPRLLAPDDSTKADPWPAASVLRAIVLTGAVHPAPPFEYVESWTHLERGIVYDWAMRYMASCSGVRNARAAMRPMPALLRPPPLKGSGVGIVPRILRPSPDGPGDPGFG